MGAMLSMQWWSDCQEESTPNTFLVGGHSVHVMDSAFFGHHLIPNKIQMTVGSSISTGTSTSSM